MNTVKGMRALVQYAVMNVAINILSSFFITSYAYLEIPQMLSTSLIFCRPFAKIPTFHFPKRLRRRFLYE